MKVLIVGATSAIASETAKFFAADGAELFLVARNADKLNAVRDDLKARGAKQTETYVLDIANLESHQALVDAAVAGLGGLDAVLIAHGTLGDQQASQKDVAIALRELNTNGTSVISLLTIVANYFEGQKKGCIAAITSVAGDRGRKSNYVYGTAKAAVNAYLSGLRNRLYKTGVTVVTLKVGFVDTPMTAGIKKNPLFAQPDAVGKSIYKAMLKRNGVVYIPWFWQLIMMIITSIPEFIFKRLNL